MERREVNRKLRIIRQGKGMTQTDLAVVSGISQGEISFLETGKQRGTKATWAKISKALGEALETFGDWSSKSETDDT